MSIVKTLTTNVIMTVAKAYCWTWKLARCRLMRRISDFDYHVFPLDSTEGLKTFEKVIEVNNQFEKTQSVKIGGVAVRYTFEKTAKAGDINLLSASNPEAEIKYALTTFPKKKLSHQTSVVNINNYRKETDDFDRQSSL